MLLSALQRLKSTFLLSCWATPWPRSLPSSVLQMCRSQRICRPHCHSSWTPSHHEAGCCDLISPPPPSYPPHPPPRRCGWTGAYLHTRNTAHKWYVSPRAQYLQGTQWLPRAICEKVLHGSTVTCWQRGLKLPPNSVWHSVNRHPRSCQVCGNEFVFCFLCFLGERFQITVMDFKDLSGETQSVIS